MIATVNEIHFTGPDTIEFTVSDLHAFSFVFSNASGQALMAGYDEEKNSFFIDRSTGRKIRF